MYFLDTCTCIDFLKGKLAVGYQMMQASPPDLFKLPSIVVAELFFGAEHSAQPSRELGIVESFVDAFEIVNFDESCAREYGRIRQLLGSQGQLIGDRDLMIAACALVHRATLVTSNIKEFQRVPSLQLESWADVDL